ncbi:MAG: T9SS type A sorting domain-containing protein [Alphaproteobacteria bacterium]
MNTASGGGVGFTIAPNPVGASGTRIIDPDSTDKAVDVTIFDLAGRIVFQQKMLDALDIIPASAFKQKGAYWYSIREGSRVSTGKLLFIGD